MFFFILAFCFITHFGHIPLPEYFWHCAIRTFSPRRGNTDSCEEANDAPAKQWQKWNETRTARRSKTTYYEAPRGAHNRVRLLTLTTSSSACNGQLWRVRELQRRRRRNAAMEQRWLVRFPDQRPCCLLSYLLMIMVCFLLIMTCFCRYVYMWLIYRKSWRCPTAAFLWQYGSDVTRLKNFCFRGNIT